MKIFVYKTIFVILCVYILYQFTIGKKIEHYEYKLNDLTTDQGRENIRDKIREEIKKANEKDKIFNDEDKELIKKFISKIQKELN
jgi:hypothetical protein